MLHASYIGYSYCNICEGTSVVLDAAYMYIDLCVCAICSGFILFGVTLLS